MFRFRPSSGRDPQTNAARARRPHSFGPEPDIAIPPLRVATGHAGGSSGSVDSGHLDARVVTAMTASPSISSPASAIREYEKLVRPARARFALTPGIRAMITPETDAQTMAVFLLHFSALSLPNRTPWTRRRDRDGCLYIHENNVLTSKNKSYHSHSTAQ